MAADPETTATTAGPDRAAELRTRMVDALVEEGTIVTPRIAEAMRAVPREPFAPDADLDEVYQLYNGVVTKRAENGTAVSSVSAPQVHAYMAEQARIGEGMRLLEIGSGGYNAALLAALAGPSGHVTTLDIDPEVTERARRLLDEAGYTHVQVVTGDGVNGFAENAPYDRILVTAQAADIPPAWVDQLVEGGLLVVPLQIKGLPRVVSFRREGHVLVGTSARLFGFVPMQGGGAAGTATLVELRDGVTLCFDDEFPVDQDQLQGALDTPRVEVRSGAFIGRTEPWADAQMWLATVLPGFGRVVIDPVKTKGLISPPGSHTVAMAAVDGPNVAYVTTAAAAQSNDVEFVVHAFGPDAARLAEDVAEQLRVWEREVRSGPGPQFHAYPAGTPYEELSSRWLVDKQYRRITISWPHLANADSGQATRGESNRINAESDIEVGTEAAPSDAEAFRRAMVDQLRGMGAVRSEAVAGALSAVPRHLFAPGEPLEKAYAAKGTLLTKWNDEGEAVSTVSAPHIQAMMLEQADIRPGMRVLEIGSSGYNAALIAELVGPTGEVTTVDIDPEVVTRTRDCLTAAGYHGVNVVEADAENGVPQHAPFDRIIVTAAAWDLPKAWWEQLVEGGKIVVPLLMRSLTRSVVFQRVGDHLVSRGYELCAFVPMQGMGAHTELSIPLHGDDVVLRLDDDPGVDVDRLGKVLTQPRAEAWSGVTMGGEGRFDGLQLWMALGLPGFGLLMATRQAQSQGVVAHAWPLGVPAVAAGDSLVYLGLRPVADDPSAREFGVYGHGPDAGRLMEQVLERIRSWDGESLSARIGAYPSATPDERLPPGGLVLDKQHTRVVVTWS